jgi:uncharacterized membrane protein
MYCKNCGKKLNETASFCSGCGTKIADENKSVSKENLSSANTKTEKISTSSSTVNQIISIVSVIGAFIVGRFLGLITFVFLFAILIGQWFPKWYIKKKKVNYSLVNWIAWSNVLTWLLPPLGILTGVATFEFSNLIEQTNKKYKSLAIISIVLSVVNAIFGIIINL